MNTTIVISLICILLLLINSRNLNKQYSSLIFVFIIITVFLGVRYMFGSDYISYLSQYYIIKAGVDNSYTLYESILYNETPSEPGWVILNRAFSSTSFAFFVFILTLFESYVLYTYVRKYVPPSWYWFSIFIFMVNPSNMLTCISMMRQYLAMSLFIFAIKYIITGKFIRYLILILAAALIHTSAIILLPIYFIRNVNMSIFNKKSFILLLTFLVALWYIRGAYYCGDIINNMLSLELFQRYELYADSDEGAISLGLSSLLYVLLFYLSISSIKFSNREEAILILISLFGILILPLGVNISLISRLSFYFTYALIFVCPIVLKKIKRIELRYLMIIMMLVFYTNSFLSFFNSSINTRAYSTYQTIFSTDLIL